MAKKSIISDFGALKGKVSFSEKTEISDVGLKVGQSVVMMESSQLQTMQK